MSNFWCSLGLAALASVAVAGTATAQVTQGPGRALQVSTTQRLAANTPRTGPFAVKEFVIPHQGVVRVRYQFKSDGNGSVSVSVSTATSNNECGASTTSTTFQLKQCNVRVVAGDRLRVSGSGILDPFTFVQSNITLQNVRLFWDVVDATSTGAVLAD
jgi:hypothetical protein